METVPEKQEEKKEEIRLARPTIIRTTSRKLLLEARKRGDRSGYWPHQGEREKARRLKRKIFYVEVPDADVPTVLTKLKNVGRKVKPHRSGGGELV